MDKCSKCIYWSYAEWIENKYGMGFGWCDVRNEATFCDKNDCMFFA